jgi:hypothetical protein
MRSLRRSVPLLLRPPVLAQYLHSVFFTIAAALHLGPSLLIQLLIFLNLQELAGVVCFKNQLRSTRVASMSPLDKNRVVEGNLTG